MSSLKPKALVALLAISQSHVALGNGYVLGFGAEGDTSDGRAASAFADIELSEKTWLSITGSTAQVDGVISDSSTAFADAGIDYWFEPVGIRLGISYWGDADILDSNDIRTSLYLRGEPGSISLDYERRNFEFDLQSDLLRGITVKFDADGIGLSTRLDAGESVSLSLGGMSYDYSRNLRVQPDIDVLRFLSISRLSMINSLIDYRVNAGIEFRMGLRSIDVTAGRWQTAMDGGTVESFSVGFLTPVSDRTDMEFRLSFDDSEFFGSTTAFSFYLYYFGGS